MLRREKYLCATLRLKKTALQVEPSLQKGASENAPEKEPEKQGGVGWGFTSCQLVILQRSLSLSDCKFEFTFVMSRVGVVFRLRNSKLHLPTHFMLKIQSGYPGIYATKPHPCGKFLLFY